MKQGSKERGKEGGKEGGREGKVGTKQIVICEQLMSACTAKRKHTNKLSLKQNKRTAHCILLAYETV